MANNIDATPSNVFLGCNLVTVVDDHDADQDSLNYYSDTALVDSSGGHFNTAEPSSPVVALPCHLFAITNRWPAPPNMIRLYQEV